MCQRAPLVPGYGTLTDLAASSSVPFGSTAQSTPLVPANSPLTSETLKAVYGADSPDKSLPKGAPSAQDRLEAMTAQAQAVEAKRSVGWSKLTSVIPQVQCGMAYINQTPFFNRGYVQCGLLNEAPIDGKIVGDSTAPDDQVAPRGEDADFSSESEEAPRSRSGDQRELEDRYVRVRVEVHERGPDSMVPTAIRALDREKGRELVGELARAGCAVANVL